MAIQTAHDLLDPTVIARAETLGLHARQIVEGYMAGEHQSPYHGFAIEFAQHREYAPGDDLRHLDWKVLGRTDRTYIKQYEQETNYVAHVLLDGSESMKYGSMRLNKLQYGKVIAACLSYLILLQRDAVAVSLFDTTVRQRVPRTNNRAALPNILHVLADFQPTEQTNIATVLHDLAQQVRRRGIVIIISDLFDDEQRVLQGLQHLRFNGHEVIVFHVLDPAEISFPFRGTVEFIGLENQPRILTRPRELRKTYRREFEAFCARLRTGCERTNTHYVPVNTVHSVHEVLSGYLAFRRRTARR
jgi:uncharacterized protein (DUF58 family)